VAVGPEVPSVDDNETDELNAAAPGASPKPTLASTPPYFIASFRAITISLGICWHSEETLTRPLDDTKEIHTRSCWGAFRFRSAGEGFGGVFLGREQEYMAIEGSSRRMS
jgi:hypothetical protein